MDAPTVSLIASILLFLGTLITIYVNNRLRRTDVFARLEETITKAQARADKLYDEKVACEVLCEKQRADLAASLVREAELKEELANKNGYIQGITDPLIKLEEQQRKELGRRSSDR